MTDSIEQAYDSVAYPGSANPCTVPAYLAAIGRLHGLDPAPSAQARVLEIGGGDGANLIPIAFAFPGGRYVGFDLSRAAVQRGQETVAALGLTNVTIERGDIMTYAVPEGGFDYVLCHGVYSWVPEFVRDGLMALIRRALAPQGIAFVSHACMPGGYFRMALRDLMLRRIEGISGDLARGDAARALLLQLAEWANPQNPWSALIRDEANHLRSSSAAYVFHDHLAEHGSAEWFDGFMARAARAGLGYVAEAEGIGARVSSTPPEGEAWLAANAGSAIDREIYLDFMIGRSFRQNLVCRAEAARSDAPDPARGHSLLARALCEFAPQPVALEPGARVEVQFDGGMKLTVDDPLLKAALIELSAAYPVALPLPELARRAGARLERAGIAAAAGTADVARALALVRDRRMVCLFDAQPAIPEQPGERPVASALARHELARGDLVSSLLQRQVRLVGEPVHRLVQALDGRHDRAQIAAATGESRERVAEGLAMLHRLGLLVG